MLSKIIAAAIGMSESYDANIYMSNNQTKLSQSIKLTLIHLRIFVGFPLKHFGTI